MLLSSVFLLASAASAAVVIKEQFTQEPGKYTYGYDLDDGLKVWQSGRLCNDGETTDCFSVGGSYEFVGDDGVTYRVKYTADGVNGFQAEGDHLPQAPAQIPQYALLRSAYPELFAVAP